MVAGSASRGSCGDCKASGQVQHLQRVSNCWVQVRCDKRNPDSVVYVLLVWSCGVLLIPLHFLFGGFPLEYMWCSALSILLKWHSFSSSICKLIFVIIVINNTLVQNREFFNEYLFTETIGIFMQDNCIVDYIHIVLVKFIGCSMLLGIKLSKMGVACKIWTDNSMSPLLSLLWSIYFTPAHY